MVSEHAERIRGYIVSVLLDEARAKSMLPDEVQSIAQDSLKATGTVIESKDALPVLESLREQYPVLEPAVVKELVFQEDKSRETVATEVAELLKQGKLEEAGALAAKHTNRE